VLGLALAIGGRGRDFKLLMFGILSVAVLGSITFLVAPTAPPWLAADEGYISGVHHVLKQSLLDLHMTSLAGLEGDASKYDVTAAVPSLHAAFPLTCLLTCINARLPRWVVGAFVIDLLSVVFAIVYMGEHYLFDAIVGAGYAVVAWLLVRWLLGSDERPAASSSPEPAILPAR
jgi:membrane-associated phospholipid phosphatase